MDLSQHSLYEFVVEMQINLMLLNLWCGFYDSAQIRYDLKVKGLLVNIYAEGDVAQC